MKAPTEKSVTKKSVKRKTLRVGEQINPDNLRYIDNQGMPYEEQAGGLWSSEVKAFMHAQTLKALFYSEDWVFITVDAIALPISLCPVKVFDKSRSDSGKDELKEAENHPVNDILKRPNPYQTATELFYSYTTDLVLGGNGFLYSPPSLNQLFNMPFERCSYDFDQTGMPSSVTFYQQYEEDLVPQQTTPGKRLMLSDVIHARRPNPSSAFWGLSPFTPGRKSVLTNRYTQDYILSFYLKGATPQMILELDTAASQKALVRMIRSFEAAYTGRRNQRRTMVLPKGVKATQADTKIVDQQFIELVKNNRETILNILRIPKHALGLQESGSLGSREHEQALRWFWEQTILPTMNFLESSLTEHFTKRGMLTEGQCIKFDTSQVSYTSQDLLTSAEVSNALADTWTLNERRDKLFGLPPLPDGDATPGVQAANPFALSAPTSTPQATSSEPVETLIIADETADSRDQSDVRVRYAREIDASDSGMKAALENVAPKMLALAVDMFTKQTEAALKAFKKSSSERASFNEKKFKAEFNKGLKGFEKQYANDYNSIMRESVDIGQQTQLDMVFDPKNKDALAALSEKTKAGAYQLLKDRGIEQYKSSYKATTDAVVGRIKKQLAAGATVDEVSSSILDLMKGQARWRANMIARTETLSAFSVGGQATMEVAGDNLPGLQKLWITARDEDVRDSHDAVDSQQIPVKEKFTLGSGYKASYPREAGMPANEAINCRCTVIMVYPEDSPNIQEEVK